MQIIIDKKEQRPYTEYFIHEHIPYELSNLHTGDYSIKGYPGFAIERKELNDFIKSITKERERFEREIIRGKELDYFAVIIEASIYDIENRRYHSKIHPHTILSTIFYWSVKYKIPFLLVESRTGGALATIELSKAYIKYKEAGNGQYQQDL